MKAKTIKGESIGVIETELITALSDGFSPNLAFVFLSIEQDIDKLTNLLDSRGIQIFGATTEGGEICNSELDKNSISILLLDIDLEDFKILIEEVGNQGLKETTKSLAQKALKTFNNPAILVSGSGAWKDYNLEKIVDGFKEVLDSDIPVYGGIAGDNLLLQESFVFTNNKKGNHAIIIIVFNADKIELKGVSFHGWNSIGTAKTITKSSENIVYEIDGEPALQLIMRFGGIQKLPDNLYDIQTEINHSLMIQLLREKGEPIMRGGVVNMQDMSLLFTGFMPEGAKIKFCLLPDLDTIDETVGVIRNFKEEEMPGPDAILLFSCTGRQISFGPEFNREFKEIYSVWSRPIAGMLSQGEIGKARGGDLELHNLATCLVALKEK